ncbi:hypothetical protein THAOC_17594 [Thalassiosira oceanica]|uniref:Uncharacterized protein n=1 Tax=Thalassiosira oceanica TaxID=159749 RepID=K0S6W9_THAOC|nr:hypothetical protein THAOC_17594 [Thalassiosira oceanica]|eukprot:EJK61843.1 hypothetical protein THAOC_17594 [Thalassiosira oceanica]
MDRGPPHPVGRPETPRPSRGRRGGTRRGRGRAGPAAGVRPGLDVGERREEVLQGRAAAGMAVFLVEGGEGGRMSPEEWPRCLSRCCPADWPPQRREESQPPHFHQQIRQEGGVN